MPAVKSALASEGDHKTKQNINIIFHLQYKGCSQMSEKEKRDQFALSIMHTFALAVIVLHLLKMLQGNRKREMVHMEHLILSHWKFFAYITLYKQQAAIINALR